METEAFADVKRAIHACKISQESHCDASQAEEIIGVFNDTLVLVSSDACIQIFWELR